MRNFCQSKMALSRCMLGSLSNNDGASERERQNNNFARASRYYVHFFAVTARLRRDVACEQAFGRAGN